MHKIFIFIFVLISATTFSQTPKDSVRQVHVIAKPVNNSIRLRWAVTDPTSWKLANKYGYTVVRYTILRNQKLLERPERNILTSSPLKPAPQTAWEKIIDENDYAAIAAQAIFGDSFEATTGKQTDVAEVINKTREIEQRFSFALFAADHSFATAKLSALAFQDTTVKNDEKYLYKIYTNIPQKVLQVDTGLFYIGVKEVYELPKPSNVTADFQNKTVSLTWPVSFLRSTYVSYVIERSDDNVNFKPTSKLPFINTDPGAATSKSYTKLDSLPDNTKTYYFRIRGIDSFGDLGPPSDVIKGSGANSVHCDIAITKASENKTGKIDILWKTTCETVETATDIMGFEIGRASKAEGPYLPLTKTTLPANTTLFTDPKPLGTNYYMVTLLSKSKLSKKSFPYMVQLADSIPPAIPALFMASIDTTGRVYLKWQANSERDLLGYRVYRSNFEKSEYSLITHHPIASNSYIDTVNLKTLTKKIYYKIVSEDTRNNRSPFSSVVVIDKPDKMAPVAPVIKRIESTNEGVVIVGIKSSSEDAVKHQLYRKRKTDGQWQLLKSFTTDSLYMVDKSSEASAGFVYALIAIDNNGNRSQYSHEAFGKKLKETSKPPIKKFNARADRTNHQIQLSWVYTEKAVAKFAIYRSTEGEPLSLYKVVLKDVFNFNDQKVQINTAYSYVIKSIFMDGTESLFSEEVKVEF